MDELHDILRRLWVSDLQARRELLEIERDALMHEITSPLTSQDRRKEAFVLRDELMSQWAEVVEELKIHEGKKPKTRDGFRVRDAWFGVGDEHDQAESQNLHLEGDSGSVQDHRGIAPAVIRR